MVDRQTVIIKMESVMKDILDVLDNWCSNNYLVAVGLVLLIAAFILSFSCKTAWGAWKNRR